MKKIIFSLYDISKKYKGHINQLNDIAFNIALYNGANDETKEDADLFIEKLVAQSNLSIEKIDSATYQIGHLKTTEYVVYGQITKSVLY